MCEAGKESEPRRPPAGAVRVPRPAQPRGPRVALPSQGSQERAAEETLAGGISGCWESGLTETVSSKARAIAGTEFLPPRPGTRAPRGAVLTATARRARRDRAAQEESGAAARWPRPVLNTGGSQRVPRSVSGEEVAMAMRPGARTPAAVGMEADPARPGSAADWLIQQTRRGGVGVESN